MASFSISYNRKQIFIDAHEIKATSKAPITFATALTMSWKIAKAKALKAALKLGIVAFCFIKADGSNRIAKGTMNEDLFFYQWKTDRAMQSNETKYDGVVRFWDMEEGTWRSCRVDRIGKIGQIEVSEMENTEGIHQYKQAA